MQTRYLKYAGLLEILFIFFFLGGEENLRQGGNRRVLNLKSTQCTQFLFFIFINWKSLSSLEKELLWSSPANLQRCDVKIAYTTTVPVSLPLSLCSKHLQTLCWKFILLSCTEETRTWKLVPVSTEANIFMHSHLSECKFSHLGWNVLLWWTAFQKLAGAELKCNKRACALF